jgi:hypothetical protein
VEKKLKGIWKKASEKASRAAEALKDNEHFNQIIDKAAEHLTEPKTDKQRAVEAALWVGMSALTGGVGDIAVAIAWATAEGVITKKLSESGALKKFAANRRNRKLNKPKDGPQPQ